MMMDDISAGRVTSVLRSMGTAGSADVAGGAPGGVEVVMDLEQADVVVATRSKMRNSPKVCVLVCLVGVPCWLWCVFFQ